MREVLVARIVQALLALVVGLILAACGPSIDDSTIGNSTNIVPSLIKEVADQPPKFSPSYKIVRGTFTDQFDIVENHKVGSYSLARDPSGNTDDIVERFYIDGKECRGTDCQFGSVRSMLSEDGGEGDRKKEAWYSFEIFIPENFPVRSQFKGRFYLFSEFKEILGCATTIFGARTFDKNGSKFSISHLYIRPDRVAAMESNEAGFERCSYRFQKNVAKLENMKGKWTRFEYFIRWTTENDGRFLMYLDNSKVIDYKGKTCSTESRCLQQNTNYYGIYAPNNASKGGMKNLEPSSVYYRNVSRASSRELLKGRM